MAVSSNNAFCPEKIISSRLHCRLRCCSSSLQGRDGDSLWLTSHVSSWHENASSVHASAVHTNFILHFPFRTQRIPLPWFPLSALEALQRSSLPIFPAGLSSNCLSAPSLPPTGRGSSPWKSWPLGNAFLMKDVACSVPRRCGEGAGCGAVLQLVKTRTAGPEEGHCFLPK